ncbi:Cysteine protease atg4 [Maudiozyma exigua]|uniref:Cysteine protease n=1 Tax=Maudiozyma exigua TaxID=34358 RepID=A0A9P6WE08_MAUEX|nr:Cysteine protease atg4 [Kazachstania exigua]
MTGTEAITEGNNERETNLVILGKKYKIKDKKQNLLDEEETPGFFSTLFPRANQDDSEFIKYLSNKLHFTYRTRFSPIQRSENGPSPMNFQRFLRDNPLNSIENIVSNPDCFTTDIGWGCMIRTGQSLLGNALQDANFGRDYNFNDDEKMNEMTLKKRDGIIKFSNMKPGQWFGPAATSTSIKELIEDFPQCGIDKCIISVSSGDIFQDVVERIFEEKEDSKILFLLGVKLGLTSINMECTDDIFTLLSNEFTVGIAGGRPSSSLYFFGYQGDELLYFDPHSPQPCLDQMTHATCTSTNYGRLNICDIDPSMLIGILINGIDDWDVFKIQCENLKIINIQQNHYSDIEGNFEEFDISSMESHQSSADTSHPDTSRNDYINIEPLTSKHDCNITHNEEPFENIQCKTQNIMILKSKNCSNETSELRYDVEPVLVENEGNNNHAF